jgi:hypothetical protein
MGNFSRDTFDPSKQYTGVRLQQGVPLVDADWNELNDVIRQELYDSLSATWGVWNDGIFPWYQGEDSLTVSGLGANNLGINGGTALVDGRAVLTYWRNYNTQPWYDPAVAAAAGVDPIPPMTTPGADRTDVVYLDVWDREVTSAEDSILINPVIGIETSVRLKREFCYRVAEGRASPPAAPAGHRFMALALLNRTTGSDTVTAAQVQDLRRFLYGTPGTYYQNIAPYFVSNASQNPFTLYLTYAYKPASVSVYGNMQLMLPHRCRFTGFYVYGQTDGASSIAIYLYRALKDAAWPETVVNQTITGSPFTRWIAIPYDFQTIDNANYRYILSAAGTGTSAAWITGVQAQYTI